MFGAHSRCIRCIRCIRLLCRAVWLNMRDPDISDIVMSVFGMAVVLHVSRQGWPVIGTLFAAVVAATVLLLCTMRRTPWVATACVVNCVASYWGGTMWGAAMWALSVNMCFLAGPFTVVALHASIKDGDLISSRELFLVTDDVPLTKILFWGEMSDEWSPKEHMYVIFADEIMTVHVVCWMDFLLPSRNQVMRRSGHHSALKMLRVARGCNKGCPCACDCKTAVRLLEDYLGRVGRSAACIQTAWRRAVSDPSYALCRKRLLSEYGEMAPVLL